MCVVYTAENFVPMPICPCCLILLYKSSIQTAFGAVYGDVMLCKSTQRESSVRIEINMNKYSKNVHLSGLFNLHQSYTSYKSHYHFCNKHHAHSDFIINPLQNDH